MFETSRESGSNTVDTPVPSTSTGSSSWSKIGSHQSDDISLAKILNSTLDGRSLLVSYEKESCLSQNNKNKLCSLIADYFVDTNIRPVYDDYRKIAKEIVNIFPTESQVRTKLFVFNNFYFNRFNYIWIFFFTQDTYISTEKNIIGKLNQRYYAVSRKYQKRGLIRSRYKLNNNKTKQIVLSTSVPVVVLTEEQRVEKIKTDNNNKAWLKVNKTPEVTVSQNWQLTYEVRRADIIGNCGSLYVDWPLLKQQIGASLVMLF